MPRLVVCHGGPPPCLTHLKRVPQVGSLIRVFAAIGCRVLIVTNAAGGVNSSYSVGDIAMIDDHIFFPGVGGQHPLVRAL